MKPVCFGGGNCPQDYKCELTAECLNAFYDELAAVPLSVFQTVYDMRMLELLRARLKTWAWECKINLRGEQTK